ncbi:MAG TPA: hypothetical protein DHN33_05715 [Eubacteriaceae bacterium]|nr:hypothetical protein [Eubacteriaceae bacterium]
MNFYLKDILSQAQELKKAMDHYQSRASLEKLRKIAQLKPQKVVFSGMGSSHFCAIGASIHLKQHGIENEVISTGELLHYESEILKEDTLLVLISQSGESVEIVRLIEKLPKNITVVAITNKIPSTLSERGDFVFDIHVSQEKSVTTRTYLGSTILVQIIAETLRQGDTSKVFEELKETVQNMSEYLKSYEKHMDELRLFMKEMQYLCLMGRGYALETVRSGSLFMREVLRFPALDFDCAEFRHGPMEMVQSDFHAIVLAPSGKTQELNINMANDIAQKKGKVVLITDKKADTNSLDRMANVLVIRLPVIEERFSSILQIVPIQLLANGLAEERNIPVGEFRWGSKVMEIE